VRRRLDVVAEAHHPAYVVWELTLRCDHACAHCGSRAGVARDGELTTDEALGVAASLAALGAREVVLIGGEAYLHDGFLAIVGALAGRGVTVAVTTGGRGVTRELARAMKDAGVDRVSVSIDGLEDAHDAIRARRGSWRDALAALDAVRAAGLGVAANTNVNRRNAGDLEALYVVLRDRGVRAWQVQLTAPLGRAADRPAMIVQPWDLLALVPRVAALKARARADGVTLMPGNNLGYFGPEEATLRSLEPGARDHWRGCQAGRFVLGVESDGGVKGCPSLQRAYVRGNLRDRSLAALWSEARVDRARWGFCASCDFGPICEGGCTFTAHAILGRPGNNPYCHHRARTLAARGLRERLVPRGAAPGLPFDDAPFDVTVEPLDAPDPIVPPERLVRITRPAR
jgi:radical SAM protein with 4Fe4S-binding SPASM domain